MYWARVFIISATLACSLQGTSRTILIQFCPLSFQTMLPLVLVSRYSLTAASFSTSFVFLSFSCLSRWTLLVFGLAEASLLMPLVFDLVLTSAFLAPLAEPLNFLFFCLLEDATRGIVDRILQSDLSIQLQNSALQSMQIELTPSQAAYLQTFLPTNYSFQTVQTKRARAAKVMDDTFTTQFSIPNHKRTTPIKSNSPHPTPNNHKVSSASDIAVSPAKKTKSAATLDKSTPHKESEIRLSCDHLNEKAMNIILGKLKAHKSSWPFRNPVNPMGQGVPNYLEVVKQPMDLKTMDRKLKSQSYKSDQEFDADFRKIIQNSLKFNTEDTIYYTLAKELQQLYSLLCKEYIAHSDSFTSLTPEKEGRKIDQQKQEIIESDKLEANLKKKVEKKDSKPTKGTSMPPNVRVAQPQTQVSKLSFGKTKLSFRERQRLFTQINQLDQEGLKNFVKILMEGNDDKNWTQIDIDFADLDSQKFRKVQLFLKRK